MHEPNVLFQSAFLEILGLLTHSKQGFHYGQNLQIDAGRGALPHHSHALTLTLPIAAGELKVLVSFPECLDRDNRSLLPVWVCFQGKDGPVDWEFRNQSLEQGLLYWSQGEGPFHSGNALAKVVAHYFELGILPTEEGLRYLMKTAARVSGFSPLELTSGLVPSLETAH